MKANYYRYPSKNSSTCIGATQIKFSRGTGSMRLATANIYCKSHHSKKRSRTTPNLMLENIIDAFLTALISLVQKLISQDFANQYP